MTLTMYAPLARCLAVLTVLLWGPAAWAGPTSKPDPVHGKELAERLCTNCHLVGGTMQEEANPDVPSFPEIANFGGQTAGAIMARIILPKHPMPQIPLEKSELSDLAAYIMSLREAPQP
jgi:mono/diheme cytochrome c family protein